MIVPLTTLTRWLMYDVGIPNKMSSALGLMPVSDEVDAMEWRDSERRLLHISPLGALVESYADIASKVGVAVMMDDDTAEARRVQYQAVGSMAIIGFLSAFTEIGVLHVNTRGADE